MHYFTKIGAGEYYLEELEETVCEVEIRYRITTTHSCLLGYSSLPRAHEQLNSVAESPVPVLMSDSYSMIPTRWLNNGGSHPRAMLKSDF